MDQNNVNVCAEKSDRDQKCGIHAVLLVLLLISG